MEKLTSLTAVAAPLPIDNCDTDQIMPKQFLRGIDKSGLARGVFFNMRCNPDGSPRADCVWSFEVAPRHRTMLMEGLDMIAATLRDMDEIERFRAVHEAEFPWMTGLAGKAKRRLEGR